MCNVRQSGCPDQSKDNSSPAGFPAYTAGMKLQSSDSDALHRFLDTHARVAVLTGAGISAPSGIPTYRDRDGVWRHAEPIKHQEFLTDPARRRRYWARSLLGWPAVRDAQPNAAHLALATLERAGRLALLITQNVDRLHQRAGSRKVVDLHGRLDRVRCVDCAAIFPREGIQGELARSGGCMENAIIGQRPDGDAEVADDLIRQIREPGCTVCGALLMPDVVFFGGTVPRERVQACMRAVEQADALIVIGSSLQVYSGFRFCRRAAELGKPLALINPGKTRADPIADLKLRSDCGPLLQRVAGRYKHLAKRPPAA